MSQEKEVTIYDLARKLNISIATVSRALKDDPVVSKKTKKNKHGKKSHRKSHSRHASRKHAHRAK